VSATTYTTKIAPKGDLVLVKPIDESTTKGGIVLPDNGKGQPSRAVVVAVGPGRRNNEGYLDPVDLNVGETVIIRHYSGVEVEEDGEKFLLLQERDVLAVVKE
jgi:chaperonin GroES